MGDKAVWISGSPVATMNRELSVFEQREERLEQDVFCAITRTGTDYPATRDDCLTLVGKVESALTADRTLGNRCHIAWVESVRLDEAIPEERRRQVGATVRIIIEGTVT
jgi:hypothetical protein